MFATVMEALIDYWNNLTPRERTIFPTPTSIGVENLPDRYNDTPYNTVIGGKHVKTVGEYKSVNPWTASDY